MQINENDYKVSFSETDKKVTFSGTIRLQGMGEYEGIKNLLHESGEKCAPGDKLVLDFAELKFLNSSGITTISMFIINMRKKAGATIKVVGSKAMPWQEKSLHNLNKLWDKVEVEIKD